MTGTDRDALLIENRSDVVRMHAFEDEAWASYETTSLMLASLSRVVRRLDAPDVEVTESRSVDAGWLATDERASRYGAGRRRLVHRAAGWSSRIAVIPNAVRAAEPTASRFASSVLA